MRIAGRHRLDAARPQVWDALKDPSVLARILPGCRSLEPTGPVACTAVVDADVGSVSGTYKGTLRREEEQAPSSCRLVLEATGEPGTVRADATVRLEELEGATTVDYEADVTVDGRLAGLGQRMLAGVAERRVERLLEAVAQELSVTRSADPAEVVAGTEPAEVDGSAAPGEPGAGLVPVGRASSEPAGRRTLTRVLSVVAGAALAGAGMLVGRRLGRRD